jgi:hypothetical protein
LQIVIKPIYIAYAEIAIAQNAVSSPPGKSEQPVLEVTHEVLRVRPFLNKVAICR